MSHSVMSRASLLTVQPYVDQTATTRLEDYCSRDRDIDDRGHAPSTMPPDLSVKLSPSILR